jgi:predicted phage terminase large subunit-like protein
MLMRAWRKHLKFSAERRLVEPLPRGPFRIPGEEGRARYNPDWIKWRNKTQEHWGLMEWLYWQCNEANAHLLIIEAKGPGISAAQELQNRFGSMFGRTAVQTVPVKGDKVARALSVQPIFAQGQVHAPARDYAELVIDEMAMFPKGRYDDLTDSATQALAYLRDVGLLQTDHEIAIAKDEGIMHRGRQKVSVYAI